MVIFFPAVEISRVEFLQFDFDTIAAATNNFSGDNKLGEGGFGEVYKVFDLHLYIHIFSFLLILKTGGILVWSFNFRASFRVCCLMDKRLL